MQLLLTFLKEVRQLLYPECTLVMQIQLSRYPNCLNYSENSLLPCCTKIIVLVKKGFNLFYQVKTFLQIAAFSLALTFTSVFLNLWGNSEKTLQCCAY